MLPEMAWSLKKGERIVGTSLLGETIEGTVHAILKQGMTYADYLMQGHSIMVATKCQHDGPTVVMDVGQGPHVMLWRPDDIKRVMDEHVLKCHVCGKFVSLQLALRTLEKMAKGELDFALEKPGVGDMITQSVCVQHVQANADKN